jgi:hypothetical protein
MAEQILPDTVFTSVEYPGNVQNVDRALVTLGGLDGLERALTTHTPVELHFSPQDPFSHAIMGEFVPVNNLLLQITTKQPLQGMWPTPGTIERAEIVGCITHTCRFRGTWHPLS